jgi:hypothetical protein
MYLKRDIETELVKHFDKKEYTIITGARQTGKTTLLKHLYKKLKAENKKVFFVSFEDIDILNAINKHPEEIFSVIPRPQQGNDRSPYYLFIDEVQYAKNPTNFLKYLYDTYAEALKIIATGSSAFYMDKKFKDSLAGRKRIFELQTLNFAEWLLFNNETELLNELHLIRTQKEYISTRKRELLEMFEKFIVYGGYPRVALETDIEEKILLLKELRNSFLRKDIDEASIQKHEKFYILLSILADQTGNMVNKNELAATVGVDNKTIDKYLFVLTRSFHISLIKPFFSNIRKEVTKMPKLFFNDTGMRNVVLNRFYDFDKRADKGALFENYIFRRLSELYGKEQIKYWRSIDKNEVDFVINESFRQGKAYEVKTKCPAKKISAATKFTEKYQGYSFDVISYDLNDNCLWFLKL